MGKRGGLNVCLVEEYGLSTSTGCVEAGASRRERRRGSVEVGWWGIGMVMRVVLWVAFWGERKWEAAKLGRNGSAHLAINNLQEIWTRLHTSTWY